MWCRAQLIVLLAALSAYGDNDNNNNNNNNNNNSEPIQLNNELQVGRSIDIFTRFGYLSLSVKVVPRNDTINFLFREPTVDVFNDVSKYVVRNTKISRRSRRIFDGDFHMEFCDNINQLVQAYFRDFTFERIDRPWRAFTASWSLDTVARNLGINSSFVYREHCYVLVRLSRYRDNAKLTHIPNNINLSEAVEREIEQIQIGDVGSVIKFIKKYGTHYIDSYVTGNSLYQVFVFRRPLYKTIKERLRTKGISNLDKAELQQYFSPWFAEHLGQIRASSGNKTVEQWASNKLQIFYTIFKYPTLLKVHGDLNLLSILNNILQNEAVLEMNMKTLAPAFKNPQKRQFFEEILDNYLKLWESNL